MIFNVNLFKTKSKKSKAKQYGTSKSFHCDHFKDQKVHEIMLDFKDSFEKPSQGQVLLRVQYIYDEELLYQKLREREFLILKWLDILQKQQEKDLNKGKNLRDTLNLSMSKPDSIAIGAGFYLDDTEIDDN